MLVLGLDTSAYTTSLALVDETERLVWEKRLPLVVKPGGLGLRQSEAVFQHLQHVPVLMQEASAYIAGRTLRVVSAAVRPRPARDSYMPVFTVGKNCGMFLAHCMGLSFIATTHQEGHIVAGLWSAGQASAGRRYLALHLSGGTTDMLSVAEDATGTLTINHTGGGADLKAGQFIDRIGVALGLPFPAGSALEKLARRGVHDAICLPVAVDKTAISFSGPASCAERLLQQSCPAADLARAVEVCIADSLARAILAIPDLNSHHFLLLIGGVAANSHIRQRLEQQLPASPPLVVAASHFAGDNAAGVAVQACRKLRRYSGGC